MGGGGGGGGAYAKQPVLTIAVSCKGEERRERQKGRRREEERREWNGESGGEDMSPRTHTYLHLLTWYVVSLWDCTSECVELENFLRH